MIKRLHFIAIGGAAMHNLALALQQNGYIITGSDDEIREPSRSRLEAAGILPEQEGWFPEKITDDIDGVILGMHARIDNPELISAREKNITVYSFPEFLYQHSKNKTRVVIGGSHGKTTITSMVLHVLRNCNMDFDYMVGAKVKGFDTMVRLSNAPIIVLEGDEYLSSPIDRRPKFHLYKAEIGLISGIAWDHINVFPTFENYLEQFRIFADEIPERGKLIYCINDTSVKSVAEQSSTKAEKIPYGLPEHSVKNGITWLHINKEKIPLAVFGAHNLMNLEGSRVICNSLGIDDEKFYYHIRTFEGAANRLQLLSRNTSVAVYKDFAHSPSKLKATVEAVRSQYPDYKLIACMELHTFSSLNENFLNHYAGTMDMADEPVVYFNPHTVAHKKLKPISSEMVKEAFSNSRMQVYTDAAMLRKYLLGKNSRNTVYLMMSSGSFDNMNLDEIAENLTGKNAFA